MDYEKFYLSLFCGNLVYQFHATSFSRNLTHARIGQHLTVFPFFFALTSCFSDKGLVTRSTPGALLRGSIPLQPSPRYICRRCSAVSRGPSHSVTLCCVTYSRGRAACSGCVTGDRAYSRQYLRGGGAVRSVSRALALVRTVIGWCLREQSDWCIHGIALL